MPVEQVFKTLVARGDKTPCCVFVIPVAEELDLKKCASVSGNKRVELIHVKELQPLTGYIRGGCSPIGMKKALPTWFHESITNYDYVYCSAGVRGLQFRLAPHDLVRAARGTVADLIVND
jgi:Cys-tRNA(Pro)/Cys-tRNA(Cys) deacylase